MGSWVSRGGTRWKNIGCWKVSKKLFWLNLSDCGKFNNSSQMELISHWGWVTPAQRLPLWFPHHSKGSEMTCLVCRITMQHSLEIHKSKLSWFLLISPLLELPRLLWWEILKESLFWCWYKILHEPTTLSVWFTTLSVFFIKWLPVVWALRIVQKPMDQWRFVTSQAKS